VQRHRQLAGLILPQHKTKKTGPLWAGFLLQSGLMLDVSPMLAQTSQIPYLLAPTTLRILVSNQHTPRTKFVITPQNTVITNAENLH
jgi:hypothetical protein